MAVHPLDEEDHRRRGKEKSKNPITGVWEYPSCPICGRQMVEEEVPGTDPLPLLGNLSEWKPQFTGRLRCCDKRCPGRREKT